ASCPWAGGSPASSSAEKSTRRATWRTKRSAPAPSSSRSPWISGPNEKGRRSGRPHRFRWCRRSAFDMFGQHGEAAGAHFGEAAAHVDALELGAGGAVDLHRAVADGRHERGVALEHAELTLRARDDHHVDVLGTDQAGRRDEFE